MNERHMLVVSLWLKRNDVPAFEAFERRAAKAMAVFGGRIERAIRLSSTENEGENPFEIHVVSFPDAEAYRRYRQSPESGELAEARDRVISRTVILSGSEIRACA